MTSIASRDAYCPMATALVCHGDDGRRWRSLKHRRCGEQQGSSVPRACGRYGLRSSSARVGDRAQPHRHSHVPHLPRALIALVDARLARQPADRPRSLMSCVSAHACELPVRKTVPTTSPYPRLNPANRSRRRDAILVRLRECGKKDLRRHSNLVAEWLRYEASGHIVSDGTQLRRLER